MALDRRTLLYSGGSQIEGSGFGLMKMGQEGVPTVMQYLGEKLQEGQCIGFDARVVNTNDAKEFAKIAAKKHGSLKIDKGSFR